MWTAQQANAEGWRLVTTCVWSAPFSDGRPRLLEKLIRVEGITLADLTARAQAGSAYHRDSLAMVGVERMTWDASGARIARTFTDTTGAIHELPL